jgi:Tfp pilus assembly protein PilF
LKARLDTDEKKYPEAEKELTLLLAEQPDNALVHLQMGHYFEARGSVRDAENSLSRALDLQPDSQEMLQNLIRFYISQKQTDRAIQRINTISDDHKKAFHYELIGLAYSAGGRLQDAETAYKKALRMEPNRADANVYLAAEYIQSGRFDEALQELDEMLKRNPFNASAYAAKGLISERQGKLEAAKKNYEEALKINPNLASPANSLAYFLAEEGRDLEAALKWAQTARKVDPENPNNADTLGWVQHKLGHQILARDQLQFAVSKRPDNPVFLYHLAMTYKATNQMPEAVATLKKALNSRDNFKDKILAETALDEISHFQQSSPRK